MELPFLKELAVIFGLSMAVLYLCARLGIPSIVGFLLTGVIVGPYGLGWIGQVHEVELLAEIGVILLLFTIGIEFSLGHLARIRRAVLGGGTLQVAITIGIAAGLAVWAGFGLNQGVFFGFLLALSSSAIVLKQMQTSGEMESPAGRTALSILIYQDLIIVPMILLIPILGGASGNVWSSVFWMIARGLAIIAVVLVGARVWVPAMLNRVIQTRNSELFLVTIISICIVTAWFTSLLGMSLGLGAFLAGLLISESEYSDHALGGVLPFRDVFISFFFVSAGMLLNLRVFLDLWWQILPGAAAVMALKAAIACLAVLLIGMPARVAVTAGLAVSQIGEFSFLLSRVGLEHGLIGDGNYQLFLAVSILSMIATPFVMNGAHRFAGLAMRLPWPERFKGDFPIMETPEGEGAGEKLRNHLIIVGYGVNGRNVARAAKAAEIPHIIIEMNPETVRREREAGAPIFYGDASHEAVLRHAAIREARVLVVAIADPAATRRIVSRAKMTQPAVHIIARTRFVQQMEDLYRLGADEVIPEEYETSVEIFTRVLSKYLAPRDFIERFAAEVRSDGYEMFRRLSETRGSLADLPFHLPDSDIATLRIPEGSWIAGMTLAEARLRKDHFVNALAVRRGGVMHPNPDGRFRLEAGDEAIFLGARDVLPRFAETLAGGRPPAEGGD